MILPINNNHYDTTLHKFLIIFCSKSDVSHIYTLNLYAICYINYKLNNYFLIIKLTNNLSSEIDLKHNKLLNLSAI